MGKQAENYHTIMTSNMLKTGVYTTFKKCNPLANWQEAANLWFY